MREDRVFNFSAGPGVLAEQVLQKAQDEIFNYHGTGMSIMEMSHRSSAYQSVFDHVKAQFKKLMHVPDNYEILFLQGGASTQFSMIPLNLMSITGKADYAVTGNFSSIACKEAAKYGKVKCVYDGKRNGYTEIPSQDELQLSSDASYFHYCANNTIYGTAWNYVPETGNVPIVCDMSSEITSHVVDISRYGLIYAGAQKNMAPAGVTVVIIRKDLAGKQMANTPYMLNYQTMIEKDSMLNTPPCWCIYMLGLTLDWLEKQGGVEAMEKIKHAKAQMIYDVIDASALYIGHAKKEARSDMNVTFRTGSPELDGQFIKEAAAQGLVSLKGHRITGGMRASIYNAMPMEGVEKLRDFMLDFERRNG